MGELTEEVAHIKSDDEINELVQILHKEIELKQQIQAQLIESKTIAEEANEAKSEFLSIMSHEIRTPLNGVIAMGELLAETKLSRQQHEYVEVINHSAASLLAIVNDILDLSKIEAGKLELEEVDFNLRALIDSIQRIMEPAAQNKGLKFSVRFSEKPPRLAKGDPTRIRQVLFNLVQNAVKFTEKGSIIIKIRIASVEKGMSARFEVIDSGIGIDS